MNNKRFESMPKNPQPGNDPRLDRICTTLSHLRALEGDGPRAAGLYNRALEPQPRTGGTRKAPPAAPSAAKAAPTKGTGPSARPWPLSWISPKTRSGAPPFRGTTRPDTCLTRSGTRMQFCTREPNQGAAITSPTAWPSRATHPRAARASNSSRPFGGPQKEKAARHRNEAA
jgi:hypothetical protein